MEPKTLDHVAFWVADREPIARQLERHFGMHVISQEPNFTLLGSDARRGKLTLFDAEAPRERGAFKHVAVRVEKLDAPPAALPAVAQDVLALGEGVSLALVEGETDEDYDLDHVALYAPGPEATA